MFTFYNNTTIFIIIIALISIVLINVSIYFLYIKSLKKMINEQSCIIFELYNKMRTNNDICYDMKNKYNDIDDNIVSLSTSLDLFMTDVKERDSIKTYPDPQLVSMIEKTINDQIGIEVALTNNMLLKPKEMLVNVINNTCKTYPMINEEYITKKSMAIIESLKNNNE